MAFTLNQATWPGHRRHPRAIALALAASTALLASVAGCTFRTSTSPQTGPGATGPARLALIVSPSDNSLISIDAAIDFSVRRSLPVGLNPSAIALAQGGKEVVVATAGDQTVRIFRRTTGDDIGPGADAAISVSGSPVAVAVGSRDSATEFAFVITRDGGVVGIDTNPRALAQKFFVTIPLPTSLGANARQPELQKLVLSKDPRTNFVRAVYITDSANNLVWQVALPATGAATITAIGFQNPGAQTVSARLDAITVKATDTQDEVFMTDRNNSNIYRATVSPTGGTASLSTGTPVNGVSVLNNNLNITAVHRAIVFRADVNAPVGQLFMPEEATGQSTGQNVALVGVKADLSDATQLRPNVNVFNIQSTQLRISGVTAMAVNRESSTGAFEFFILGGASRTITTITLNSTGLSRAAGAPQTFPIGTNNPIAGSDIVITTN